MAGDVVLLGGGATAISTDGMFASFDFDLVAPDDDVLKPAMLAKGFSSLSDLRAGRTVVSTPNA